jgi:hypothetical protein
MAKFVLGLGEILSAAGVIGGKAIGAITNTSLLDILDGDDNSPASISDADGTRIGDTPRQPPLWWGNFEYPPPTGRPISIAPPPQMEIDPAGDGGGPEQSQPETYEPGNNPREQRAREAQRAKRTRRARESRERKEADDIPMVPPRGFLLPYEDDDFDINDDPNETDEERDARRRRSDILRRGQQAGLTLAGGASAGAIYETWKNRSKWVLKNSGTIQGRKYPIAPSIPSSGGPSDLDPSQNPPEDPIYPAQPNPIEPTDRSNASCIRPSDDFQRAVVLQNVNAMDCSCD